jgi:hypothetical protein
MKSTNALSMKGKKTLIKKLPSSITCPIAMLSRIQSLLTAEPTLADTGKAIVTHLSMISKL